jgi:hypothetical protein
MSVFTPEALYPTGGVHEFLFSGEEGMALGADFDPDAFLRGAGGEFVAAGAAHRSFYIIGMDIVFHDCSPEVQLKHLILT